LYTRHIIDLSNPDVPPSRSPLTLGLYVGNFIHFSKDPKVEWLFESLLSLLIMVDFMGTVEWLLGTHFQWNKLDDKVSIYLSQTSFAAHLVKNNNAHLRKITPDTTLFHSSLPIKAIPESNKGKNCPAFIKHKQKYQSVIGSVG
jgi:hypothetical protein